MTLPIKVYFAQPIDFVQKNGIQRKLLAFRKGLESLPIKVLAPYEHENTDARCLKSMTRDCAREIVQKDLEMLKSSDVLVADISREDRQAIGIVFEIAHAKASGKYVIVHTGQSSIGDRIWMRAYADVICRSWQQVFKELSRYGIENSGKDRSYSHTLENNVDHK